MNKTQLNIALLIVAIFIFYVLTLPLYNGTGYNPLKLNNLVNEYSKAKDLDKKYQEAISLKNSGEENVKGYNNVTEDNRNQIGIAVPRDKNLPKNLNDLDKLSAKYNLEATGFNYSKDTNNKNNRLNNYNISFSLSGDYKDFLDFLTAIDKSIELYNIKSLTVANTESDIGTNKFNYKIQLETFEKK